MLSTRPWPCAIVLALAASAAAAAPRVSVRAAPECGVSAVHCTPADWADRKGSDPAQLVVEGAGAKAIRAIYFSDDGTCPAQLATDSDGNTYLLLEYRIGRRNAPSRVTTLAIFHVTDRLVLLRKVQLRYWLSPFTTAEYSYRVQKPFSGGLTIEMTRRFIGKTGTWHYPPPTQIVSIPPQD